MRISSCWPMADRRAVRLLRIPLAAVARHRQMPAVGRQRWVRVPPRVLREPDALGAVRPHREDLGRRLRIVPGSAGIREHDARPIGRPLRVRVARAILVLPGGEVAHLASEQVVLEERDERVLVPLRVEYDRRTVRRDLRLHVAPRAERELHAVRAVGIHHVEVLALLGRGQLHGRVDDLRPAEGPGRPVVGVAVIPGERRDPLEALRPVGLVDHLRGDAAVRDVLRPRREDHFEVGEVPRRVGGERRGARAAGPHGLYERRDDDEQREQTPHARAASSAGTLRGIVEGTRS